MSEASNAASRHPGMGAIPGARGAIFRAWAPHAENDYVTGIFNDWSKTCTPFFSEHNGCWTTEVPGEKTGDEYGYMIHPPADWQLPPFFRIDPYARKLTNPVGNGIIYDPAAFDRGSDHIKMASWNDLVIYEMYIGAFNVGEQGHPGTLDSAMEKFPYLLDLGINAIEVMPVMEFPGDFSLGYNRPHPSLGQAGPAGQRRCAGEYDESNAR